MAACFAVVNFWGAFNELLLGYLQDKEALGGLFNRDKWGRRTPWLIVGTVFGAMCIVIGSLVVQLNFEGNTLPGMYFFVNFCANMCYSAIGIAFSSATIELFAFNEERMEIEGMSVVAAILGVYIGVLYTGATLTDATIIFPLGVVVALLCFIAMLGVPLMKDAKMPADKSKVEGYFKTMGECMKNKAFAYYCAAQFFDGMATNVLSLFFIERIQFVIGAGVNERTTWFFGIVTVTLFTQLFMSIFLGGCVFNRKNAPIREVAIGCRVLDIIMTMVMLNVAPQSTKAESRDLMFIFVFLTRALYAPRTFWSTAARDWAIDEDIHKNFQGGGQAQLRKEASYASLSRFFGNLGNAISATVFFYGLVNAGFDVEDCRPFGSNKFGTLWGMDHFLIEPTIQDNYDEGFGVPPCTGAANDHAYASQCCKPNANKREDWGNLTMSNSTVDEGQSVFKYESFAECCYEQVRISQPASVEAYIKDMWSWAMPILHIPSLIFMILYPIHGERLKKLYAEQNAVIADAALYKAKQLKQDAVEYGKTEGMLAK